MVNKFDLGDIVTILKYPEEYKIVGMHYDTYNKSKKIWYQLYRMSDGHISVVAENAIKK